MYVILIKAGRRTLDRVPIKFRDAVKAKLDNMGLDGNDNSIETTLNIQS